MKHGLPVIVTIAFSIVGVVGDYFLKLASEQRRPLGSGSFYLGFVVYASTAFGWVYVVPISSWRRSARFTPCRWSSCSRPWGSSSSVSRSTPMRFFGLAMAIGSLVLLTRFA